MKNYLLLLRKDDIIDWFKSGSYKPYCASQYFDVDIKDLPNHPAFGQKLLDEANEFDYSADYYIVHVTIDKAISPKNKILIECMKGIYALDEMTAKIGIVLDPEITVHSPIWPDAFNKYTQRIEKIRCLDGIINLERIFNMEINKYGKTAIEKTGILDKSLDLMFSNTRPSGELSIWTYLLRYERHNPYPSDTRGFFIDAVHVYNSCNKQMELDANMHEKSTIGKMIIGLPENVHFHEIVEMIKTQKKFKTDSDLKAKNFYIIAPLFLCLKSMFEDGMSDNVKYGNRTLSEIVETIKKKYDFDKGKSLGMALYLLGITLGRQRTYYSLYKDLAVCKK